MSGSAGNDGFVRSGTQISPAVWAEEAIIQAADR